MNNQRRQIIVFVVGVSVAFGGMVFRFMLINNQRFHDAISFLTTLGQKPKAMSSPSWDSTIQVAANVAMALFYSGLLLMIAAVLAWLFLPHRVTDEKDAA
jgi:hypothetical protein